jgi:hypothetical protein
MQNGLCTLIGYSKMQEIFVPTTAALLASFSIGSEFREQFGDWRISLLHFICSPNVSLGKFCQFAFKLDAGSMQKTIRRAVGLTSESSMICSQGKPGENCLPISIKCGNRLGLPGTAAVAHNLVDDGSTDVKSSLVSGACT